MNGQASAIVLEDNGSKGRYVLRSPTGGEAEMTFTRGFRCRPGPLKRRCSLGQPDR